MSIFPMLGGDAAEARRELPLLREVKADPETGLPIFRGGRPVIAEGAEALSMWISTALRTVRYQHEIYSTDFGCEAASLIGQGWSDSVQSSEAPRMVRDALRMNPYIQDVSDVEAKFEGGRLHVSGSVKTIYGEVDIGEIV